MLLLIVATARLSFLIISLPKNPNKINFPWKTPSLVSLSYITLKWLTDANYDCSSQMKLWMHFKINENDFSTQWKQILTLVFTSFINWRVCLLRMVMKLIYRTMETKLWWNPLSISNFYDVIEHQSEKKRFNVWWFYW